MFPFLASGAAAPFHLVAYMCARGDRGGFVEISGNRSFTLRGNTVILLRRREMKMEEKSTQ